MAITKVSRNLLSTGIDDQSNATAITIDSSENVGISATSPFSPLHVSKTDWSSGSPYGTVATIEGNNVNDDNWGHLIITDTTTSNGNGGSIRFATGSTSSLNPIAGIQGVAEGTSHGGVGIYTRPSGGTATERMSINSAGMLVLQEGNGLHTDTLRNDSVNVGTTNVTILDFSTAGAVGAAKGFYLVTVVRVGSSVGTHGVYLVGLSTSNAAILYETLRAGSGVVASTSGANFQLSKSGTAVDFHATAIPIGIVGN